MNKVLFISASEYVDGNTSRLGRKILSQVPFQQLNLVDYRIFQLGQHFSDDEFEQVIAQMQAADLWLIGSPVYWHNMSGHLKTWFDRMSEYPHSMWFGKKVGLGLQGMEPSDTVEPMDRLMRRFADLNQMDFLGTAVTHSEIQELNQKFKRAVK